LFIRKGLAAELLAKEKQQNTKNRLRGNHSVTDAALIIDNRISLKGSSLPGKIQLQQHQHSSENEQILLPA
jgi:hypothetical protein